jgi:hypothetical protein
MVSQAPDFAHGLVFDFFTKLELFLIRGNSNRKKIKVSSGKEKTPGFLGFIRSGF